jgi:hypothetical protein
MYRGGHLQRLVAGPLRDRERLARGREPGGELAAERAAQEAELVEQAAAQPLVVAGILERLPQEGLAPLEIVALQTGAPDEHLGARGPRRQRRDQAVGERERPAHLAGGREVRDLRERSP